MKKYDYQNLKEDEHVYHSWEVLDFKINNNYDYVSSNIFLNFISNILIIPIALILYILDKVLFGFKIIGKENLTKNEGFVSISNHIHPLDCTMIGLIYFPRRVYYPTIIKNFQIPFIRHLIRLLFAMPIPTDKNQKLRFFNQINTALKKGKIVHMYPEGSMWPYYEDVRHFKYGAFKMAVDAGVPIKPVKFIFKEKNGIYKLYKKNKCIHAVIIEPIYPNLSLPYEERINDLKERTYEKMKETIWKY